MKTKELAIQALIASVYVALSFFLMPYTFGPIQVRVAEMTLLLLFFNKRYSFGIILGCLITNMFSPLGLVDVVFGTLATALTCLAMIKTSNIYLKLLWPGIINGLIVGLELTLVFKDLPFIYNAFFVLIGEVVAVFIPGIIMRKRVLENNALHDFFA